VLHATNGYATALLPSLCSAPRTIVPCRAQVVAVRPHSTEPGWPEGTSAHEGFDYLFSRPTSSSPDARPLVILGGGRQIAPAPHEMGVSDDTSLHPTISRYLRDFLPHYFPGRFGPAREVDIQREWTGIMGMTRDRDPLVRALDRRL
jgi:glycine/D-amino acid oxidase-like deaminating enzyme